MVSIAMSMTKSSNRGEALDLLREYWTHLGLGLPLVAQDVYSGFCSHLRHGWRPLVGAIRQSRGGQGIGSVPHGGLMV